MGRSPVIYDNLDGFVLLFTPSGKMLQTCLRFRQIFFQQERKDQCNCKRLPAGFIHQCEQFLFFWCQMRAESISYIEPVWVKNRRIWNLVFPKISIKKHRTFHRKIRRIPFRPVQFECQLDRLPGLPGSHKAILQCHKCFLSDSGEPYLLLLFQAFQMKRVLLRRISCHMLCQGGIIVLHFPPDILAVLQGKVLYRISIIFLFRSEGINNIKIFLFFLQKSRITKKNPLVGCHFLIIKCQFPRCVFLLNCGRCRKAGLKAIFRNCRDPHFLISPVSRQDSERQHGNPWPLADFFFPFFFLFHCSNSPVF